MMWRLPALLFILSFLSACGYHPQGFGRQTPGGVRTVHVELFANGTLEPFLETRITSAVVDRFARGRALRVVDGGAAADAVLSGRVASYLTAPVSYARNDEILEYRSSMTVFADLRRAATGESLWKGSASWSEEYQASADRGRQEDSESEAIRVISARIAEELYDRLVEDF